MKPSTTHPRKKRPPRRPVAPPEEMLYGINPVEAALRVGRRRLSHLYAKRAPGRLEEVRALAEGHGLSVTPATDQELERLCGSPDHQGAVLAPANRRLAGFRLSAQEFLLTAIVGSGIVKRN